VDFTVKNRPSRMGTFFRFTAEQPAIIAPAVGGTVCLIFVHDWGPVATPILSTSFAEWQATFGYSTDTEGYRAARSAFKGEGGPFAPGAGAVLSYRVAGADAAEASHVLQNTTPAAAITFQAKSPGSYGNDVRLTVQDRPGDTTKDEFLVLVGTAVVERYVYTDTDVAGLAAQVNDRSDLVVALGPTGNDVSNVVSGVKLTAVSGVALAGGDDGDTIVVGDYTTAFDALSNLNFGVLAAGNLTDGAIITALKTWTQGMQAKRPFRAVVGGALDEDESDAATRSAAINDPAFVNLGVGSVRDNDLGGVILSTAELAPRYAGILANRGEYASASAARLYGCEIVVGPSDSDVDLAFDDGVVVLGQDSDADSPVRFERSVTTFTDTADPERPYLIFREPKFVATMHGIQRQTVDYVNREVLGRLPVNDSTRSAVISWITANVMRPRAASGVIGGEFTVTVTQDPPPSNTDDFLSFDIGAQYGRSTEQVFINARMG
jgi:hypothetical protein